jgi:hypothetical protein
MGENLISFTRMPVMRLSTLVEKMAYRILPTLLSYFD